MGALLCALSNFMYLAEKLVMWLAAVMVLTCLVATLIMMLGLGVGLGYNYCFVDVKTRHKYVKGHYEYELIRRGRGRGRYYGLRTDSDPNMNETNAMSNETNSIETNTANHQNTSIAETSNNDMTSKIDSSVENVGDANIETDVKDRYYQSSPIDETDTTKVNEISSPPKTVLQVDGLDLMTLLSKLKSENISYTLQIVTT